MTLGVCVCVRRAATVRRISLGSEGNALYPVLCIYLHRRLASGEGIVTLGVCVCVCVSAEPQLYAALVSAAKVTRCIERYLVKVAFNI